MSKPILRVRISTSDEHTAMVSAVLDSGSFYTILRENALPSGAALSRYTASREFGTARKGGKIRMVGELILIVKIGRKSIRTPAYVSPDLNKEMLLGAEAMQAWDISILNRKGRTTVQVGRDMDDPDITEID